MTNSGYARHFLLMECECNDDDPPAAEQAHANLLKLLDEAEARGEARGAEKMRAAILAERTSRGGVQVVDVEDIEKATVTP